MRHVLALDLKDDPALIAAYERSHAVIWPEVRDHLLRHGVLDMEIFRIGTRLVMVMDTDDTRFDATAMARASDQDATLRAWETLMGTMQVRVPGAAEGVKWAPMQRIFSLAAQGPASQP